MARIEQLNVKSQGKTVHAINKFSDLTVEEFKNLYLMPPTKYQNIVRNSTASKYVAPEAVPTSFDWASKNAITPVKDQGQCGSFWDSSATETLESVCFLAGNPLTKLSEQQTVDCDHNDDGCNGGYPYTAYEYMISAGGVETEADYPYTAEDGSCHFDKKKVACVVDSWKYVTQSKDESAMQAYAYANSPLSVCVDAETWQTYSSGVVTRDSDCGNDIDHCVQITGWDVKSSVNAWHVRNSWGSDWGENGYIWVEIGYDVCSIAEIVTVPCVKSKAGKLVC